MEENRRKSTSLCQLELLIAFMEKHNNFAKGKLRSKEGLTIASQLWAKCAGILNTEGVTRTPKEWSRFWNDYKCRVRARVAKINRDYRPTRGRPAMTQQLTPLEARVAALLGRAATGAANTSSAEHTPAALDLSSTMSVETPPIVTEHEQKAPVHVGRVNQSADEGTSLPKTVRPRNQGQRRIRRRVRPRVCPRRQNTKAALDEIRGVIARIEEMLTQREKAAATSQRKLEALTSIATSFDIIATSLHTYVTGLQRE